MPDAREQAEAVAAWMNGGTAPWGTPPYAESLDAMREVEDEIERRGMIYKYGRAMFDVLEEPADEVWKKHDARAIMAAIMLRATPAQRLEAAYRTIQEAALGKVMEEEKHEG